MTSLPVIGRVTPVAFLDAGVNDLPAKVDTGAYRSSVWASNIHEKDGRLYFTLLGPKSPYYSGKEISTDEYRLVQVESSFGHKQQRYSVFLRVQVGGRVIRSNFTLANRAAKTYPALVGRKMLKGRFVVDVAQGQPLKDEEEQGDDNLA